MKSVTVKRIRKLFVAGWEDELLSLHTGVCMTLVEHCLAVCLVVLKTWQRVL